MRLALLAGAVLCAAAAGGGALLATADHSVVPTGRAPPLTLAPALAGPAPASAPPQARAAVAPGGCADPAAPAVRSALPLTLVAGVSAERPRESLATLAIGAERRLVRVGERFAGTELLGVEWIRPGGVRAGSAFQFVAVVCNDGTKEYVAMGSFHGEADAAPRPGLAVGEGDVQPVGPNQYDLDRRFLDRVLGDPARLPTLARIVPSSRSRGYQVSEIPPATFLSAIGLEDGDVIQRVNGRELASPEQALALYQALHTSSHLSLELDRNGQSVRLEYNVKTPQAP